MGQTALFNPTVSSASPYTNQWFFNGVALAGATNLLLQFVRPQPSLYGDYFLVSGNDAGSVTSQVARLKVFVPGPHAITNLHLRPDGAAVFDLGGGPTATYGRYYDLYPLRVSTNLVDWTPLATLQYTNASPSPLTVQDPNAAGASQRFYGTPTNVLVTPSPQPTGPYPIGTFSRLLTAPTRTNGTGGYKFMATVWYPASAGPGMVPVPYVDKAVAAFDYYYPLTNVALSFRSHSVTNVALATNTATYPVVLYSPEWAHHRRENTDKVEDLVSWGYVVVGIDGWDAHVSVFPDGTVHNNWEPDSAPSPEPDLDRRVADLQFVMDELARWNVSDPLLAGRLDLDHIGAFGWALGGASVAELCLLDHRCRAGVDLDGALIKTNLFSQPVEAPFLALRADNLPDPDPGWAFLGTYNPVPEDRLRFFNHATTNAYWIKLSSTVGESYADFPLTVDPVTFSNYWGFPVNGQLLPGPRTCQIVRTCLLSFFNKYLRGQDDHFLDDTLPNYPEVLHYVSTARAAVGPEYPMAGLTPGSDGNLYGTTAYGGAHGAGTLFRMTPGGQLTTLISFDGAIGRHPMSALLPATDGNFYGTTADGGTNRDNGTVFRMTPAGVLTTLVSFAGTNGSHPYARLTQASNSNFYGTTLLGGTRGDGTVFQMTAAGELTTLVSFSFTNTGAYPAGALLEAGDGNFYGTAANGTPAVWGTVFKMTPAGQLTNVVKFTGANGGDPIGGLIQGTDGNYYGTTEYGGNMSLFGGNGFGRVFKLSPTGVLASVFTFTGANGSLCLGPLMQDSDGNFYGTTYSGGPGGGGTVFKLTPAGVLTTLVAFNGANGRAPMGPLVKGADGNFYGTTKYGGLRGAGTVFKMTPAGELTTLVTFGTRTDTP